MKDFSKPTPFPCLYTDFLNPHIYKLNSKHWNSLKFRCLNLAQKMGKIAGKTTCGHFKFPESHLVRRMGTGGMGDKGSIVATHLLSLFVQSYKISHQSSEPQTLEVKVLTAHPDSSLPHGSHFRRPHTGESREKWMEANNFLSEPSPRSCIGGASAVSPSAALPSRRPGGQGQI